VTGASSGIGKELTVVLHREGARVVMAARRGEVLDQLKEELIIAGGENRAKVVTLDLSSLDSLEGKAEEVIQMFGQLDVLINCGGVSVRGGAVETMLEVHKRVMDTNYFGTMELTRHLVPHLKAQGGLVVNISSLQGRIAIPHRAAYAASKHALQAWSDSLRAELACQGVSVLVVSPGYVRTELSRNAITEQGTAHGEMDPSTEKGYSAAWVAEKVLEAVQSDQQEVVLAPIHHRLAILLRAILPSFYFYLMARRAKAVR